MNMIHRSYMTAYFITARGSASGSRMVTTVDSELGLMTRQAVCTEDAKRCDDEIWFTKRSRMTKRLTL